MNKEEREKCKSLEYYARNYIRVHVPGNPLPRPLNQKELEVFISIERHINDGTRMSFHGVNKWSEFKYTYAYNRRTEILKFLYSNHVATPKQIANGIEYCRKGQTKKAWQKAIDVAIYRLAQDNKIKRLKYKKYCLPSADDKKVKKKAKKTVKKAIKSTPNETIPSPYSNFRF